MNITELHSLQQVEPFRDIRGRWRDQLKRGFFYAEGEQVFARLLESEIIVESILLTPGLLEKYKKKLERTICSIVVAEKSRIEQQTSQRFNQGVIAIGRIPKSFSVASLQTRDEFCVVALNGLDHAVNVGTILRNCAAFAVDGLITDSGTLHPYCWRSVRSSLGGVFQVPFLVSEEFTNELKVMQSFGAELIAADPAGSRKLSELTVPKKVCVILGNEHKGLEAEISNLGCESVAIPISGKVDSLNVASASAILLYELSRRRTS